jgi:hypothetical protein
MKMFPDQHLTFSATVRSRKAPFWNRTPDILRLVLFAANHIFPESPNFARSGVCRPMIDRIGMDHVPDP